MRYKVYRRICKYIESVFVFMRILHFRLKYGGLKVHGTFIDKHCDIRVCEGGQIVLVNSHISFGVQIICDPDASIIIEDTYIGPNSVIVAGKKIHINRNCLIAEMVTIRDQNHNYGDKSKSVLQQGFTCKEIIIEENVWIGAKSTILKGVTIRRNVVVAAHSVVNRDCDPDAVYGGIPAMVIKKK